MANRLTDRQKQVLIFIQNFFNNQGFPPTLREIGAHFKIAPPSVLSHLRALEKKGFIRRIAKKPRCIEICKDFWDIAA